MRDMQMEWVVPGTASELVKKYFDAEKGRLGDTMIHAGAGAGKTTELVRRVISIALIQKKITGEWPRLVVTTFTRKATQELRERLMLGGLTLALPEVSQALDTIEPGLDLAGLSSYLQSSQSLHISTIHGILSVYLKRFGSSLELPPDFQLVDDRQAERLFRQTLRGLLQSHATLADDFQVLRESVDMRTLEEGAQMFAAIQLEQGTKLRRLTRQEIEIDWMNRSRDLHSLAKDLVAQLEICKLSDTWASRIQALQNFASAKSPTLESIRSVLESGGKGIRKNKAVPDELIESIKGFFNDCEKLQSPFFEPASLEKLEDLSLRFERLSQLWCEKFTQSKIQTSLMTMEDLELFSLRLVRDFPETAAKFSDEWDYWLVDEYQDTSPRQVHLIEALTQNRKLFLVGDPQQSIYLFRGARAEVFKEASNKMLVRRADLIEQMTNYRTSAPVLEFMNDLFTSVSPQLSPMTAGRDEKPLGFSPVTLWQVSEDSKKDRRQVDAVVQRLFELQDQGVALEDICVISRKKADLALIAKRATELGVPCQLHAAGEFYKRQEIRDAMLVLKFLLNPDDNVTFISLMRSPWLTPSDQDILQICRAEARSFWSVMKHNDWAGALLETRTLLLGYLDQLGREGVARTWRRFLIERGFFDYAQKIDPSGRREANLWKLVQSLLAQERNPGFQYFDFVEQSDPVSIDESSDGDASPVIEPKRVQLMTVHGSKGLQFPHILVPYLEEATAKIKRSFFAVNSTGQWSLSLKDFESNETSAAPQIETEFEAQKQREIDEMDRVFYVALTRAQDSLHLFWQSGGKSKWAQKLDLFVDGSIEIKGPRWSAVVRHDEPNPQSRKMIFTSDLKVRDLWQAPSEMASSGRVLTVTQVLSLDPAASETAVEFAAPAGSAKKTFDRVRRSVRGTEVHRLLESLKYDPQQKRARPEFAEALAFLDSKEGLFLRDVIKTGEVEWGFAAELGGHLIQGQIDLWGRDADGQLWVVDYKTGNPEKAESALRQLEIYAWALMRIGKIAAEESVMLAAVFPFHGRVVSRHFDQYLSLESQLKELVLGLGPSFVSR